MKRLAICAAAVALLGSPALAQQAQHQGNQGHGTDHGTMAKQDYMKSMQGMHQQMMSANDPDPDRAFALKMIEHHKGGIAMAQVVQQHGDDAEIKRMAQKMTDEQRKDIAELQSWLDRHGGRSASR